MSEILSEYVNEENEFGHVDGVLRRPAGPRPRTIVLQTHPRVPSWRNLNEEACRRLATRGFATFGYNNRFTNSTAGTELITIWEELGLDVAAAIHAMRSRGYRNVVLYGVSAGGPLVSFYQNVAANGNRAFDPDRTLSGFRGFEREGHELRLPPGDALILQSVTPGPGHSFVFRLDPSVVSETPIARDPALDMFETANGYDPETGCGQYSPSFLAEYGRQQAARMNRLIAAARARLALVRRGSGPFLDDAIIEIGGVRGDPAAVDLSLAASTSAAWPLLPTLETQIVHSNRRVIPGYRDRNLRFRDGGTVHTLRSFLSYRATRVDPERYRPWASSMAESGVDGGSSNASTPESLSGVTVPILMTLGTADTQVHLPDAELSFGAAASTDKRLIFVNGAEHDMSPIESDYGDTQEMHFDYVARWLTDRFGEERDGRS